jgi:hypothetical protein
MDGIRAWFEKDRYRWPRLWVLALTLVAVLVISGTVFG